MLVIGCGSGAPLSDQAPGTAAEPIAGGTLDTSDDAVFEEFTHWVDTDNVSSCTANLIAPNVLLTARHCIASANTENVTCGQSLFGDPVAGTETIVTPDATPGQGSTFYHGMDVRVPTTGDDMCGYDVALIILKSTISSIPPLVPRIDVPVQSGEEYDAVGYGVNAQGEQNAGRMLLSNLAVHCLSDECQAPFGVAPTEFMGQAGICSGDSGGPALDAEGKIIGIVSRGSNPCATPIYSEVAPWRDFITQTVLEAAQDAGYRAPFWAYSGSSDAPTDAHGVGEAFANSDECAPGSVCYYDGDPSKAKCTSVCGTTAQCAPGEQCTLGFDTNQAPGGGLCLSAPVSSTGNAATGNGHGADQGCSLAVRPLRPAGAGYFSALGFGLALLGLRRRRSHPGERGACVVEPRGIEPLTSALRTRRSPS